MERLEGTKERHKVKKRQRKLEIINLDSKKTTKKQSKQEKKLSSESR